MNTRRAEPGKTFRQERFASSAEFERGLMANLVAKRCELLTAAADRELIYFLQFLSHSEGGLRNLAADLIEKFADRLVTLEMQKIGVKEGRVYNAKEVLAVRADFQSGDSQFPLKGEHRVSIDLLLGRDDPDALFHPVSYPVSEFKATCLAEAREGLEKYLVEICLNPAIRFDEKKPWYFPTLIESLREFMSELIESKRRSQVVTEVGHQVYETLDYALGGRCMVIIDGVERIGKTCSVKAWCDLHPGQARYVQVPSSNDDIGFYRAIAKSLGVSTNLNSKAQQLRERIEEVLQSGHLMVVFDEAHYLWPNSNYREALPGRINWIMTALVNHGVPVALVTTPQFIQTQKRIEQRTLWRSGQFIGRIGHYQKLPDSLSASDLDAVARAFVPEGDAKSIELLRLYAQGSAKYLAGIEAVARRARFLANRAGRSKVICGDIKKAINESVIPSDSALATALSVPTKGARKTISKPVSAPIKGRLTEGQDSFSGDDRNRISGETPVTNLSSPNRGSVKSGVLLEA